MARQRKPALVDPAVAHEQYGGTRRGVARLKELRETTTDLASGKALGRKPPTLMGTQLDGRASTNLVRVLHEAGLIIDRTNLGDDIPWTQNNSTVYISYEGVALRVQHEDGTERLVVDTTSPAPTGSVQLRSAADFILYRSNNAGIPTFRIDGDNGALYGGGSTPAIAVGAALGSGATASILWGNDTWMYVILNPGTSGMAIGVAATITFAYARSSANYGVWVQEHSTKAVDTGGCFPGAETTTTFTLNFRVAPSASGTMHYLCFVGGAGA